MRAPPARAASRTLFLAEANHASRVAHPGLVTVYDQKTVDGVRFTGPDGERVVDGVLYLDVQHVDGPDLHALLRREGPLPAGRAVRLVAQVASALDALHRKALGHRDVGPSDVLVVREEWDRGGERPLLTDVGIVCAVLPPVSSPFPGTLAPLLVVPQLVHAGALADVHSSPWLDLPTRLVPAR